MVVILLMVWLVALVLPFTETFETFLAEFSGIDDVANDAELLFDVASDDLTSRLVRAP